MVGICRLCASVKRKELLATITNEDQELCQRISLCCKVNITMEDGLPKVVCRECALALNQFYTFYIKVKEAQESLAMLFPVKQNTEISSEVSSSDLGLALVGLSANTRKEPDEINSELTNKSTKNLLSGTKRKCSNDNVNVKFSKTEQQTKCTSLKTTVVEALDAEQTENDSHIDLEVAILPQLNVTAAGLAKTSIDKISNTDGDGKAVDSLKNIRKKDTLAQTDVSNTRSENDDEDENVELLELLETNHYTIDTNEDASCDYARDWSEYPWECLHCTEIFTNLNDFKTHTKDVHLVSEEDLCYRCADCQKVCSKYFNFLNHVRLQHRNELTLCCDACNKHFENYTILALHRETSCSAVTEEQYPEIVLCHQCGRAYQNKYSLHTHIKNSHVEQDPLECEHCDKVFKRLNLLQVHMKRVHSGVRDHKCNICGASFGQKINLQTHMVSHTDDKPFKCSVCDKRFKTSTNLHKHALLHSEPRQYKCDFCEQHFRTKDAKLSHERTHTGEKPYLCQFCDRRFRYRSVLTAHVNTHTGVRPYSCEACNHHFTNWSNFNKHLKRRHNITATEASCSTKLSAETAKEIDSNKQITKSNDKPTILNIVFEDNADSTTDYLSNLTEEDSNADEVYDIMIEE